MNLSFLYPLAWLGAAAIAVPVWLHLERRRAADVVRFSALQFLEDQPTAQREPLWPRDWLLLLLRIAALLLIVAAFAWPYLPRASRPTVISRSTVYVLDNTLSHQADGQFDAARRRIETAIASAPSGQQFAVVELTAVPRVVVDFPDSPDAARAKLQALEPSHQRGSYRAAMLLALERLRDSLGEVRQIVVAGDHQENQWQEFEAEALPVEGVQVSVEPPAREARANLAVMRPQIRRVYVGKEAFAEVTCQLVHQGSARTANIALRANGAIVRDEELPLENEPEALTVAFRWPVDPAEWLRGEFTIRGEGDSLLSDNRAVFSLPPVREGRVALLANSKYLQTALGPEILRGRWRADVLNGDPIASAEAPPDVMCVESSQLNQRGAQDRLLDHLNSGGGALLVLDDVPPAVERMLRQFELVPRGKVDDPRVTQLRYIYYEHPLFQPFRSGALGDLTQLHVTAYQRIDWPGAMPLVFSGDGDPLVWQGGPHGRLFVVAFALDRAATNWPLHTSFIPFLDRCLELAREPVRQQGSFAPGEACVWSVPADGAVRSVALRRENKTILEVPVSNGQARFLLPDEPSWYELAYNASPTIEAVLDVNPSPDESQLKYTDPSELAARWNADKPQSRAFEPEVPRAEAAQAAIMRQRLWWWLLVAGVMALWAETVWLAGWRESSHVNQATH